jgi:hypothetical protein
MFTRTARLLLRPGWAEDARALAAAIGEERIVRNLTPRHSCRARATPCCPRC